MNLSARGAKLPACLHAFEAEHRVARTEPGYSTCRALYTAILHTPSIHAQAI